MKNCYFQKSKMNILTYIIFYVKGKLLFHFLYRYASKKSYIQIGE